MNQQRKEIPTQRPISTGLREAPIIPGTFRDREQRANTSNPSFKRRLFTWFKESRTAHVIAAVTLGAAMSQTPAGKDATQKILDGTADITATTLHVIDNHFLFGPHSENNPWAKEAIKRVTGEAPLASGEHFAKNLIVKADQPLQTKINVYPFISDRAGNTPVSPIGEIPVGTELKHVLMTMGHMPNTVDLQEMWGVVPCDAVANSITRDGKPIPDLTDKFPVCAIPVQNLQAKPSE